MKVCPSCGFHNADDAMFCEECGAKLNPAPAGESPARPGGVPPVGGQTGPQGFAQNQTRGPVRPAGGSPELERRSGRHPEHGQGWSGGQSAGKGLVRGGAPVQRPRKPMKKPGKNHIIAAVEALVLVIAIVVFCVVGSSRTSPTRVAEQYCRAVLNGDWERICQLADVPDSPFLTREAFDRYLGSMKFTSGIWPTSPPARSGTMRTRAPWGTMSGKWKWSLCTRIPGGVHRGHDPDAGRQPGVVLLPGLEGCGQYALPGRGFPGGEVPTGGHPWWWTAWWWMRACVEHLESTDLYRLDFVCGQP